MTQFIVRQAPNPAYWDVTEVLVKEQLILGHNIHPASEETKTPSEETDVFAKPR